MGGLWSSGCRGSWGSAACYCEIKLTLSDETSRRREHNRNCSRNYADRSLALSRGVDIKGRARRSIRPFQRFLLAMQLSAATLVFVVGFATVTADIGGDTLRVCQERALDLMITSCNGCLLRDVPADEIGTIAVLIPIQVD